MARLARWDRRGPYAGPAPGRPAVQRGVIYLVWLVFVIIPVTTAIGTHGHGLGRVLVYVGAIGFSGSYVGVIFAWRFRAPEPVRIAMLAAMFLIAGALCLGNDPSWGYLFIYLAAVGSMIDSPAGGFMAWALSSVAAAGVTALAGGSSGTSISYGSSAAGVGLLMLLVRDLRGRNDELVAARAELARLAVAQERERFARDLHDLLGHSLSVIAIKAELAGRFAAVDPARAAAEIGDVERIARQALSEVRDAVSGYRQPTLDDELAGARMALSAAGIECSVARSPVTMAPEIEAVLAWAVREGATNVIRHSAARVCRVSIGSVDGAASIEVVDDGRAGGGGDEVGGAGLAGLRQRAAAFDGAVLAGPLSDGGFRLQVTVPLDGEPADVEDASEVPSR